MGFDAGDVRLSIDGSTVAQFTGADFDTVQSVSPNEGPAGVHFGFNFQRKANGCNIGFTVRQTSPDLPRLAELARTQKVIDITCQVIDNLGQYDPDEPIGFSTGKAVITMRGLPMGRGDATDVTFSAIGIGYRLIYQAGGPFGTAKNSTEVTQPVNTTL